MNLLTDPLLRVQTRQGLQRLSLPGLLAALGQDDVEQLPGIQQHQADGFHVFLCYLAGAVLARRGETDPVQDEAYWRQGLRALAGPHGDNPWILVVSDATRPAFLQPPLPKADVERLKPVAYSPDELDLLPTAKNHDLKQVRAVRADVDEWVYALVSLQTLSGFYGRGNQGISRMNGGYGNRSIVELVRSHRAGVRWQDAVIRLLRHREELLAADFGFDPQGLVLVWQEPWDGSTMLPLSRLDPFYVEICRRIRLVGTGRISHAEGLPADAPRLATKALKGVVGDPWLPVDVKGGEGEKAADPKALTVPSSGLSAELLRRLIFAEGLQLSALQRPLRLGNEMLWLRISVLIRGEGVTEGFHERHIPIPPAVQPRLFGPPQRRSPLAELSRAAIDCAGKMQQRVLRPAVLAYLTAAHPNWEQRDSLQAWWRGVLNRFQQLWSDAFFPWLWSVPEPFDQLEMLRQWVLKLRDDALQTLREAEDALPSRIGQQYRARVAAERRFWASLYAKDTFPFLRQEEKDEHTNIA